MESIDAVLAHDWITAYRGGERVLEALWDLFPDAPLYTLLHKVGSGGPEIEKRKIITSHINSVPGIDRHYPKFLPLFPSVVGQMKIKEKTKLLISSSHCVIKGLKKPEGSIHISYIHSPMRYIYDQFDNYFGSGAPLYQRMGGKLFRSYLTNWDLNSNNNVDHMIANSWFVHDRIKKYYSRDSVVIHPFVDLKDFRNLMPMKKEDYFLMVGAFTPNKRVDLAIDAFNNSKLRLKIIGSGHHESALRKIAGPNIEFLGNVSRAEVVSHLAKAQALIFPGVEDFGITPLESLAAGTPVIAFRGGGVVETMTEETAQFFDEANQKDLLGAVLSFKNRTFEVSKLKERAELFSKESFQNKVKNFLGSVIPNFQII